VRKTACACQLFPCIEVRPAYGWARLACMSASKIAAPLDLRPLHRQRSRKGQSSKNTAMGFKRLPMSCIEVAAARRRIATPSDTSFDPRPGFEAWVRSRHSKTALFLAGKFHKTPRRILPEGEGSRFFHEPEAVGAPQSPGSPDGGRRHGAGCCRTRESPTIPA
jgi:hypothetical protein